MEKMSDSPYVPKETFFVDNVNRIALIMKFSESPQRMRKPLELNVTTQYEGLINFEDILTSFLKTQLSNVSQVVKLMKHSHEHGEMSIDELKNAHWINNEHHALLRSLSVKSHGEWADMLIDFAKELGIYHSLREKILESVNLI